MRRVRISGWFVFAVLLCEVPTVHGGERFGFGKADITPSNPLRLTGYPERKDVCEGVDARLFVRALAIESQDHRKNVLVSLESRGLPGRLTVEIAKEASSRFGIPRSRLVLASTGSHSTPHLTGGPENLLEHPLSKEESEATQAYTEFLKEQTLHAIGAALADLSPGTLKFGKGDVKVSVRNPELRDASEPDTSVPVLAISGDDGKLRGVLFNHACSAQVLPATHNRVSGDWPGYAQSALEDRYSGVVALAFVGCGGDVEPAHRGTVEAAKEMGDKIAGVVNEALEKSLTTVMGDLVPSFGYAGLAPDRPDAADLTKRVLSPDVHLRRHATEMLKVFSRMGRLPESYPSPVHVWRFGNDLNMVFLGGSPSIDYARRIQVELSPVPTWVSAECDDDFGYVASKATREKAKPRTSRVPLYYYLPGPWVEETEEVLVGRIKELWSNPVSEEALEPAEALVAFRLSEGLAIDAVATEPLVADPINFAFGPDGKLWVVEMGDYPRGVDGKGKAGGTIKVLEDTNGDGKFDKGTTFLEGLGFPTGVLPWRQGALVSCAPEIFYAEDTDGDGRADLQKPLFTGFDLRNPQHRVNGFTLGLDNWVYVAADTSGSVRSEITGKEVALSGRDCRIRPDTGEIEPVNGVSQYGREKDNVGHWFGNENWAPIWHYLVPDRYVGRNPYVPSPPPWVAMTDEIRFPRVYPSSRTVDRFNDLFTANRFTSACSPSIYRDEWLQPAGAAMVCEPVHNLVHRLALTADGLNFRAERLPAEKESEFVSSTDTWFRPVRVTTGPDGAVWIADMYRQVIEHPEWIPEAWQQRLDVRSGQDKGRIYRVFPEGKTPAPLPNLAKKTTRDLVETLDSANGWRRDIAQRLLIERQDPAARELLESKVRRGKTALGRLHALCALEGLGWLEPATLRAGLADADPFVRAWSVLFSESMLMDQPELAKGVLQLADDPELAVRFQVALSLGGLSSAESGKALGAIACRDFADRWMRAAVISSASHQPERILAAVLAELAESKERDEFVEQLITTTIGVHGDAGLARILESVTPHPGEGIESWHLGALAGVLDAAERGKLALSSKDAKAEDERQRRVARVFKEARAVAANADADPEKRQVAIRLIGRGREDREQDLELLEELLGPKSPPEVRSAAIGTLARITDDSVPGILLSGWRGYVPEVRGEVLDVLLSRKEWTSSLLEALESRQVPPEQIDAARREGLLASKDKAIAERARDALRVGPQEGRKQVLDAFADVASMEGNLFRGAAVFQKTCSSCHEFRGRGTVLGANLATLQERSSPALLVAVLDPNRAVEAKYQSYTIVTNDGRQFTGLIVAETTSSVTLARPDGKKDVILRVDIEEMAGSGKSFMPEGLEKDLSKQDLADVFAFLRSGTKEELAGDEDPSAAREILLEANTNGLVEVMQAPRMIEHGSWIGTKMIPACGGEGPETELAWKTEPVPLEIQPALRYMFRLPIAFGELGDAKDEFVLSVNGASSVRFAPSRDDASWSSTDGKVLLGFLAVERRPDGVNGVLDIEVSSSLLKPGESARLSVTKAGAGTGWFGLLPMEGKTLLPPTASNGQ